MKCRVSLLLNTFQCGSEDGIAVTYVTPAVLTTLGSVDLASPVCVLRGSDEGVCPFHTGDDALSRYSLVHFPSSAQLYLVHGAQRGTLRNPTITLDSFLRGSSTCTGAHAIFVPIRERRHYPITPFNRSSSNILSDLKSAPAMNRLGSIELPRPIGTAAQQPCCLRFLEIETASVAFLLEKAWSVHYLQLRRRSDIIFLTLCGGPIRKACMHTPP